MTLRSVILLGNTAGLLGYLTWLVYSGERILYTQAGILYLLPCLPFFFVFFFLFRGQTLPDHDPGDRED